jgi:Sec7-like guanine-nucleotide exchange factor
MSISRENVALPDRMEGEAPMKYLSRVEAVIPKSQIPVVLSKKVDDFIPVVLRSFMRKFAFFGDPLDMALRKILTEIDLPKETQQIDRVVQSFADRYHECNPGIFSDSGTSIMVKIKNMLTICRKDILYIILTLTLAERLLQQEQ